MMDYGETRPPIRPANMAAVEELERALDQAGAPEVVRGPAPMMPPIGAPSRVEALAEDLGLRWQQLDAKVTILMHLVSVLCTRFNVEQAEVEQAKLSWRQVAPSDAATKA
jgi:hypothetical protein